MFGYKNYIDKLALILQKNNVCSSHGIQHAISVMINAKNCINSTNNITTINDVKHYLSNIEIKTILLAALLHDADDGKFFPDNKNYENLRLILEDENQELIDQVIYMVNLVSSSKNGDTIPDSIKGKEWMLIPRYADRLEAIGMIGIERCFQYGKTTKNPLFVSDTPKCFTFEDIWNNASEERYNNYKGKSKSMVDHYYDKLIRLSIFPIRNEYLDYECNKRRQPIIDFVLFFSNKGTITESDVEKFIKSYSNI